MEWRLPKLRDYQEKGLTLLRQAYSEGHKKIMLFAATGSGKGVWFLHLVANPLKKNLKVCLVMRRRQLVLQSARRFQLCGINPSIFMGTEKGFNPNNNFQICSIDTIARREIDFLKDFDIIICDESHDCVSPTYQKFLSNFNDKIIIGLTATPFKIGNKNHSYWDACIKPIEAHELMELGYLVPCSLFIPSDIDLSHIETDSKTRDYKTKQLSNAMSKREIVGDIVENYKKIGNNKQAICFCVDKQHSKILCQEFNESGIKAMHADESTKQKERDDILNKFKRGEIQVITNVMIFSTGLDLPQAEVGIMARPTKSEVLWIQQVGRLLRPYRKCGKCNTQYDNSEKCPKCGHDKPSYIKNSAIIIDHGANSIELGHPYDVRYPDMGKDKEKQKREKSLLRTCKQCFFVYPAQIKTCPNCNNVNKLPERLYETKQGEIVPYDEFSLIKNYYDGLLKSERIMAWRRNAKYFKLYEKFGSKVMKYKKEFSIPPWIPKIIEKQKKEELQGKLYDGSET